MNRLILFIMVFVSVTALRANADPIVIKAEGKLIDDVTADIILDADKYNNQVIDIQGVIYPEFGFVNDYGFLTFADANQWFDDNKTVIFTQSHDMREQAFRFYFQPSSREGRKYALSLTGKYYTSPQSIASILGIFVVYKIPYGPTIMMFLVQRFVLNGQTYEGTLPERITNE